jgi:hypothetical protein
MYCDSRYYEMPHRRMTMMMPASTHASNHPHGKAPAIRQRTTDGKLLGQHSSIALLQKNQ